jgi:phosphoribosylanthranilate isomerase
VAYAVRALRPYAVDVASGVEVAARKKGEELMRRFVAQARNA